MFYYEKMLFDRKKYSTASRSLLFYLKILACVVYSRILQAILCYYVFKMNMHNWF